MSKKNGRTVTQHLETQRVDLKGKPKPTWSPFSSSFSTSTPTYVSPYAKQPGLGAITYTSPYSKAPSATGSTSASSSVSSLSSNIKPSANSVTNIFKPSAKSTSKPAESTPFVSLGNSNSYLGDTKPKASGSIFDAQGSLKPTIQTAVATAKPNTSKSKLKPARVYIFNNEKFDTKNEFRAGSAKDVKALRNSFEQLKCEVEVITDANLATVKKTVRMRKFV